MRDVTALHQYVSRQCFHFHLFSYSLLGDGHFCKLTPVNYKVSEPQAVYGPEALRKSLLENIRKISEISGSHGSVEKTVVFKPRAALVLAFMNTFIRR
jgi:hypothetical protein